MLVAKALVSCSVVTSPQMSSLSSSHIKAQTSTYDQPPPDLPSYEPPANCHLCEPSRELPASLSVHEAPPSATPRLEVEGFNCSKKSLKGSTMICNGRRATVKISESDKNKNRLYYYCEQNKCEYFRWRNPLDEANEVNNENNDLKELKDELKRMDIRMQALESWTDTSNFFSMFSIYNYDHY